MPDSGLTDNVSFYTSSFHDTYVRQQVVTTCTSATRPTAVEGRVIYETDTDLLLVYDGSAWVTAIDVGMSSYSPTLTNITIGNGTQAHNWKSLGGKTILVHNRITFGTTTSFTGWPLIAPPATLNVAGNFVILGRFQGADVAPGNNYAGGVAFNSGTQVGCYTFGAAGLMTFLSATSPFTWAAGDVHSLSYIAEIA